MDQFQNQPKKTGSSADKLKDLGALPFFLGIIIVAVVAVGYLVFRGLGLL